MTVPSIEFLLIAGRAVFLLFSFVVAAVAFTRWRRAAQAQTAQVLGFHEIVLQRLSELEARVDATKLAVSRVGERVDRPQQLPPAANSPAPGYQIAIRLAKGGASREDLSSGCGLSTHEAELVHRLHSPLRATGRIGPATAHSDAA
jgi:alkylation response protein AidB-like acyl-CoA dehydrogenase